MAAQEKGQKFLCCFRSTSLNTLNFLNWRKALTQKNLSCWSEVKWKSLSRVWLFVTPWTIHSPWNSPGQNNWSGQRFPSPRDLPNPGIEPRSRTLQVESLPSEPPGKFYVHSTPPFRWVTFPVLTAACSWGLPVWMALSCSSIDSCPPLSLSSSPPSAFGWIKFSLFSLHSLLSPKHPKKELPSQPLWLEVKWKLLCHVSLFATLWP